MICNGRFTLLRTTLLDYPGKVAGAVFLPGCHLRCPYCHNPELVDTTLLPMAPADEDEGPLNANLESFKDFLERRSGVLGGIVFSGGEALLHPMLEELILMVKNRNLAVKLDTAGLLPEALGSLLDEDLLDYVAVDLKTDPLRYSELGWNGDGTGARKKLENSLGRLVQSGIEFEVRTTVVPGLVDEETLIKLIPLAEKAEIWVWQAYHPGVTLDPAWADLKGMDETALVKLASDFPDVTEIRIR